MSCASFSHGAVEHVLRWASDSTNSASIGGLVTDMVELIPLENDNQRAMVILDEVFTVLPTCVVGLRLWTRRAMGQILWSDGWIVADYVVLVAYWML